MSDIVKIAAVQMNPVIKEKEKNLETLNREIQKPDFWNNKEKASEISQEASDLKEEIARFQLLEKELNDLNELNNLAQTDEKLEKDIIFLHLIHLYQKRNIMKLKGSWTRKR